MGNERGRANCSNKEDYALEMKEMPDIFTVAGLTFRHYRGESDLAAMLAVHEGCRTADHIDPFSVCYRVPNMSAEDYARDVALSLADGSNRNVLLAEHEGRIIAHSRLEWWNEWDSACNAERRVYLSRGWVLPEWRGKGIGTSLLHWSEARARIMDEEHAVPGELAANASDGEQDSITLLQKEGYQLRFLSPELAYEDFSSLPPVAAATGFEIRPLELSHCRAVAHALIEANTPSNLTPEQLAVWIQQEEPGWTTFVEDCDPAFSRIGWYNGEVAGLHLCRRVGSVGDVANVAVRPVYRMRGLARALMFACLHAMREQGLTGARLYTGIGTDRNASPSGAYQMYLGLGFRLLAFHNRYRKPLIHSSEESSKGVYNAPFPPPSSDKSQI